MKTLIIESKLLFVAYSFVSLVMRKPTRGLNLETNKSWNSSFTAISELGRRKQFDTDFSFQERKKKNERKEISKLKKQ